MTSLYTYETKELRTPRIKPCPS